MKTIKFEDKRGRGWERFSDMCYYDMICVRCLDAGKKFNSELSFHFNTGKQADEFIELLKIAS